MNDASGLQVGQTLWVKPEGEGPAPVLVGASFDVFCFYGGLSAAEVEGFARGGVLCGVYVENAIPVLALDIEEFGLLVVAFNIFAEPEDKRRAFFESDPLAGSCGLILCDHPQSVVRAIRTIRPGPAAISEIKRACFDQLTLYPNITQCFAAMTKLFDSLSPDEIRNRVVMARG
ncbi:hypothetical protein JCM15519_37160 [Fundidesulfovibrio butyratiphilus]